MHRDLVEYSLADTNCSEVTKFSVKYKVGSMTQVKCHTGNLKQ